MSNRTAESNRAISEAWKNEQNLVREGLGTRDWTPEQQKDILERGKAYDENGKAFEGQHMKSAEEYPEYQGDPGNIQFLTREEHLAAHEGSWQNPTNWHYDPETGEKTDFGNGPYIPCETSPLSSPISRETEKNYGDITGIDGTAEVQTSPGEDPTGIAGEVSPETGNGRENENSMEM